jgi:predicted nucleotide-binding protein
MSLRGRFERVEDLIDALLPQRLVQGNRALAGEIARQGSVIEFAVGDTIIEQDGDDREAYFLLTGDVAVLVNKVQIGTRMHGVTVGEMSAVNPHIRRSATVRAMEPTVAVKVGHEQLAAIADAHPEVWKLLARDLASRLEQRNQFVGHLNSRPRLFLICSAEALEVARTIRVGLDHEKVDVIIWSDENIFGAGRYPLEALEEQLRQADFALAIAQPDDLVESRGVRAAAARDNVVFELGLFMGRLGRERTLLLVPRRPDLQLPSDFKGLTPISYKEAELNTPWATALGATIDRIIGIVRERGTRTH